MSTAKWQNIAGSKKFFSFNLYRFVKRKKMLNFIIFCRSLREVTLEESIRYRPNDEVEKWLNQLLCLDANIVPFISSGTPSPEDCNLYYVNRDTLFCYHRASENFLQRIMALFVASHYKNTPDDLQLLRLVSHLTPWILTTTTFQKLRKVRFSAWCDVWFETCTYF